MEKFITAEANHGLNPQSKFFEPLKPRKGASQENQTLAFHLIIADPNSDSSLTPNWSMPETPLLVPSHITISGFFSHLREQLPLSSGRSSSGVPSPAPSFSQSSSSGSSSSRIPLNRRPKLGTARLFLTSAPHGLVLPMVKDDREWDYRGGFAKVDLMDKTEAEWRFFKELVLASEGAFKVYVAVTPAESREFGWGRGFFGRKG